MYTMPANLSRQFQGLRLGVGARRCHRDCLTQHDLENLATETSGRGLKTRILKAVGKPLLKFASNQLFGPVGAAVSNALTKRFGKNPEARPISAGEKHVILPTKHGLTRANWAGPGTHVAKRLKRGDRGVDGPRGIDAAAKRHDLAYVGARTAKDVRAADNRMLRDIRNSTAGRKTKAIATAAMQGKKLGEDLGLFNINTFTQVTEDDKVGKGNLPADKLLSHVSKHLTKKRKRLTTRDTQVKDRVNFLLPIVMAQLKARKKRRRGGQTQSTGTSFIDLQPF